MRRLTLIDGEWNKECKKCKRVYKVSADTYAKAIEEMYKHFHCNKSNHDTMYPICRNCENNRVSGRISHNLTKSELLTKQEGLCDICKISLTDPFSFHRGAQPVVDHDYKTGKSRGIVCTRCNIALGWVEKVFKDPDWLDGMIMYLRKHNVY